MSLSIWQTQEHLKSKMGQIWIGICADVSHPLSSGIDRDGVSMVSIGKKGVTTAAGLWIYYSVVLKRSW